MLSISENSGVILLLVVVSPILLIPLLVTLLRLVLVGKVDALNVKAKNGPQHVLVTGGSSGIGLEVAKLYAKAGDKVTIVARNQKKLDEAKADIVKETGCDAKNVQALSCDVGDGMKAVTDGFAAAKKLFGPIDVLINSAGITYISSFDTSDINEYEKVMRVNYLGSVYATRAVIDDMKAARRGSVVFVSSQVAQVRHTHHFPYSLTNKSITWRYRCRFTVLQRTRVANGRCVA